MPLKPCPDCGREVSTEAKTCPECGREWPHAFESKQWRGETWGQLIWIAGLVVVFLILLGIL